MGIPYHGSDPADSHSEARGTGDDLGPYFKILHLFLRAVAMSNALLLFIRGLFEKLKEIGLRLNQMRFEELDLVLYNTVLFWVLSISHIV